MPRRVLRALARAQSRRGSGRRARRASDTRQRLRLRGWQHGCVPGLPFPGTKQTAWRAKACGRSGAGTRSAPPSPAQAPRGVSSKRSRLPGCSLQDGVVDGQAEK